MPDSRRTWTLQTLTKIAHLFHFCHREIWRGEQTTLVTPSPADHCSWVAFLTLNIVNELQKLLHLSLLWGSSLICKVSLLDTFGNISISCQFLFIVTLTVTLSYLNTRIWYFFYRWDRKYWRVSQITTKLITNYSLRPIQIKFVQCWILPEFAIMSPI